MQSAALGDLMLGSSPWAWRPSRTSWFEILSQRAAQWQPAPELGLDAAPLVECLVAAAKKEADWLHHPSVTSLTSDNREEGRVQQDFQLAIWTAANARVLTGKIVAPEQLWAWSRSGGFQVRAGVHDLRSLGSAVAEDEWPWPIAVDVWCRSIGLPSEQSWAETPPSTPDDEKRLQYEIRMLLRALTAAKRNLPECVAWMTSMTQVVVPLRRVSETHTQSASSRQHPGLVYITLKDEVQILEALTHETAHQHLFMAEVDGPLVDPTDSGTYSSPLREDARPLLGVLLAYHALAYICAFYVDAVRSDLNPRSRFSEELRAARLKVLDAEGTLESNSRALTESGRQFFELTRQVVSYSEH